MSSTHQARPVVYEQRRELLAALSAQLDHLASVAPVEALTLRSLLRVYLSTLPTSYGAAAVLPCSVLSVEGEGEA